MYMESISFPLSKAYSHYVLSKNILLYASPPCPLPPNTHLCFLDHSLFLFRLAGASSGIIELLIDVIYPHDAWVLEATLSFLIGTCQD